MTFQNLPRMRIVMDDDEALAIAASTGAMSRLSGDMLSSRVKTAVRPFGDAFVMLARFAGCANPDDNGYVAIVVESLEVAERVEREFIVTGAAEAMLRQQISGAGKN